MVNNKQPTLAAAMEGLFQAAARRSYQGITPSEADKVQKDYGRLERRRYVVV